MYLVGGELVGLSHVAGVSNSRGREAAGVQLVQLLDFVGSQSDTWVDSCRAEVGQDRVELTARQCCVGPRRDRQFFGPECDVGIDDGASPTGLQLQLVAAIVHVLESA